MKYLKVFVFILLFIFSLKPTTPLYAQEDTMYFFYGEGCPHCAEVLNYFEQNDLINKYKIEKKEIYFNHENALLYTELLDNLNYPQEGRGVPTLVVGSNVIVGDKPIIDSFKTKEVDSRKLTDTVPVQSETEGKKTTLTIAAIVAGSLVDAINPCAFAVLIILMTTIITAGNQRKALLAGLAFSTSIFLSYLLMGLGIYKALSFGGASGIFFKVVGILAIILGLANLKDYFWYGKGFLMEVPLSWRPRLKSLIHSVISPSGAFLVGFAVSLFLLPCTSGPYIVILGMLAKKALDMQAVSYLILYNLIFISPMLLITLAVYKGFDPNKAEEMRQKRLKILHLIAGVIMLGMGAVILLGLV